MYQLHCAKAFDEVKDEVVRVEESAFGQLRRVEKEHAARFDKVESLVGNNTTAIGKLTAIVTNGLSHRVKRIEALLWAAAGGILLVAVETFVRMVVR